MATKKKTTKKTARVVKKSTKKPAVKKKVSGGRAVSITKSDAQSAKEADVKSVGKRSVKSIKKRSVRSSNASDSRSDDRSVRNVRKENSTYNINRRVRKLSDSHDLIDPNAGMGVGAGMDDSFSDMCDLNRKNGIDSKRNLPSKEVIMRSCLGTLERVARVCTPVSSRQVITHFILGMIFAFVLMIAFVHFGGDKYFAKHIAGFVLKDSKLSGYTIIEEDFEGLISSAPESPKDFSNVDLSEFWEVWRIIERDFVGNPIGDEDEDDLLKPYTPTREDLIKGAIRGLTFSTKDKYTTYLDNKVAKNFEDEILHGSITGIGAYIGLTDGFLTIIRPISGSPAESAGLKNDDIITDIDGESVEDLTLSEATSRIKGKKGTEVVLSIIRAITLEELEITVVRDEIIIPTVEFEERDGVFVISLSTFTRRTPNSFAEVLKEYVAYAAESDDPKLLLDMRGNSGGVLSSAVTIAGFFLPTNSVVLYDYNGSDKLRAYRTDEPVFTEGQLPKITILLDGASASATEILAAALRYHEIADIVGTVSTGKGSVQTLQPVGEESSLLKITIAQWLTPEKKSITDVGVIPDEDFKDDIIKARRDDVDLDINEYVLKKATDWLNEKE